MSASVSRVPVVRTSSSPRAAGAPPAIWAAFLRQGAWKNWVLVGQMALIALLVLVNMRMATRAPDVVVVGPDGKGQYLDRRVASDALLSFIQEQKGQPSDVTVTRFTRDFVTRALAINSSTVAEAWPEALGMMAPELRARLEQESTAQKLIETYRLAQVRTRLTFDDLDLVERTRELLHVRATVTREKHGLLDRRTPTVDRLHVDLVQRVVPRSAARPDGLEVLEWRLSPAVAENPASPSSPARAESSP